MFHLRFDEEYIQLWSERYTVADDSQVEAVGARARGRGYYTKEEILVMCRWTTARTQKLLAENDPDFVERQTRVALSTYNEELRMTSLTDLRGISVPTATVLLHFGFDNRYPILNAPALWSLGYEEQPAYTLEFWQSFVEFCRELAAQQHVSLRTLDRALKQYAHDNHR